jgi:hypothetical protein
VGRVETVGLVDCAGCTGRLDHCHGTLVRHGDGSADCTEPGCVDLDGARHPLATGCDALLGGCACVDVEVTFELRAS